MIAVFCNLCGKAARRRRAPPLAHGRGMSRKAKDVVFAKAIGSFNTAGCLVASLGYSQIKPPELPADIAIVLWLPESDDERQECA